MGSFRLEKGFKAFGSDMTKDHCATECLEPRFLRLEKNFIGRDALALAPPPSRHLVHLAVDSASDSLDPVGNEVIRAKASGEVVGFTTSGGYGYLAQRSIAFGYVSASALDQELTVEILGKQYDARVNEGPFRQETQQRRKAAEPPASAFQHTQSSA